MMKRLIRRFRRTPSCHEVMEVLQAYLDGEVDADTARRVAGHLDMCEACTGESDVYRRIKSSLAGRRRSIDPAVLAALEDFGRNLSTAD